MKRIGHRGRFAFQLIFFALIANSGARAASIVIANPGFETPSVVDSGFTSGSIDGWIASGGGGRGVFNPTATHLVAPTEGVQVGYIDPDDRFGASSITQSLSTLISAGTRYVLEADFAYRLNCCGTPTFSLALLAGGTSVASFTGGPSEGFSNAAFKTATVEFVAPLAGPLLGQALGIRISTVGPFTTQIDFDNVRLNASPVPLPAASLLFGTALAITAGLRRYRLQRSS